MSAIDVVVLALLFFGACVLAFTLITVIVYYGRGKTVEQIEQRLGIIQRDIFQISEDVEELKNNKTKPANSRKKK